MDMEPRLLLISLLAALLALGVWFTGDTFELLPEPRLQSSFTSFVGHRGLVQTASYSSEHPTQEKLLFYHQCVWYSPRRYIEFSYSS